MSTLFTQPSTCSNRSNLAIAAAVATNFNLAVHHSLNLQQRQQREENETVVDQKDSLKASSLKELGKGEEGEDLIVGRIESGVAPSGG